MAIPQSYYTSSTKGLRGSPGFQTTAATPTLPADTITALERLGGYVPPLSAPTQPNSEQIAQMPVSLVFSRLPNGSAVIGQSKYVGKDYTGRYGNYFAHFIVLSERECHAGPLLPILLWRSAMWQTTESPTTELAPLLDVEPGPLGDEELDAFLRATGRVEHLAKLITAVEKALGGGLRVILAADSDSIALWIFAVTISLPAHLGWSTTFTTYTKNPAQISTLLAGTTIDSDFGFSPFEIEHQYSVFDFLGSRFSRIEPTPFARMVIDAYERGGVDAIASFSAFATEVAPKLPSTELAPAFACYALLHGLPRRIPDVEICQWCALYVAALASAGMLPKVLDQFNLLPLDMPSIRAIHNLFNAAAHAELAAEVEEPFLRMLLKVVGTADLDWLRALPPSIRGLRLPALPLVPPDERDAPVRSLREPLRLCAAVQVWDALGWLAGRDKELRGIGKGVIATQLKDPQVRQALQTVIASRSGVQLMEGVAEYLQELAEHEGNFPTIRAVLAEPRSADILRRIADDRSYAELAVLISHEQHVGKGERPINLFRAALAMLDKHGRPLDATNTALAFRLAWGNSHPSSEECQSILDSFVGPRRTLLASSRILDRIAESLVERRHSLQNADYVQIDDLLVNFHPILGLHAVNLEAILFLRQTESSDPAKSAKDGLSLARQLQEPLRTATLRNAAWFIVWIDHPQSHEAALESVLRDHGEPAAVVYADALGKLVSIRDARRVDRLGRIVRTWFRILTGGPTPVGANHIDKALSQMNQSLNKQQRAALRGEVAKGGGDFLARWEQLTAVSGPDSGFISNLFRIFGGRR